MTEYIENKNISSESELRESLCDVLSDMGMYDIKVDVKIKNIEFENKQLPNIPNWEIDVTFKKITGETVLVECKSGKNSLRRALGQATCYSATGYETWIVVDQYNPFMLKSLSNEEYSVFFFNHDKLKRIYEGNKEKTSNFVKTEDQEISGLLLHQIQAKADGYENKLNNYEEIIAAKDSKIKSLENEIKENRKELEHKNKKLERLKSVNSNLKDQVAELDPMDWINERERLKSKIWELGGQVN